VDCAFHALVTVRRVLEQEKIRLRETTPDASTEMITSSLVQNALDILRVLESPPTQDEIDDEDSEFLCAKLADEEGDSDGDDVSDSDSDREEVLSSKTKKRSLQQISSTVAATKNDKKKKKRSKLSLASQVFVAECHAKEFSKAWILLLSFPMSQKTVKLILKHLPDNVVPHLQSPLLLADYLSTTVKRGGIVAILAIESLFQMIVQYNLDYPNFFAALYDLCTPEVFAARYRNKFMRLLHRSLKSTNIPAYVAAAFIKKLINLCLHIPGPPVMFCLTQV
jgi:U3 small nucleolar RNA-associated protein 19